MSSLQRRALAACVGAMLAVSLAGCVSLPDHSSVQRGRGVGVHRSSSVVFNHPSGPQPGADKTSIVEHYMQAMLSFPLAPSVVRQFLTPAAGRAWTPTAQLRVYERPVVTEEPDGTVSLGVQVLGSLDARGSWASVSSASSGAEELDLALDLTKVAGEWRIANPPAGTLFDSDFFARYYHQYSLFYFDPTHTLLAPDPVYLLLGDADRTSDSLVSNLLKGPTPAMGDVVGGEVPDGTRLTGPVTVSASGLADVPLSEQVQDMPATSLRFFAAQLAWTLRQERLGVNQVRLITAGQVLPVPGLGDSFSVDAFQGYDPSGFAARRTLYALNDDRRIVSVSPDGGVDKAGALYDFDAQARSLAVDQSGAVGAVVTRDGTQVEVGDVVGAADAPGNHAWLPRGHSFLKPSWDVHDVLWVVDRTPRGAELHVVARVDGQLVKRVLAAPGITGEDVRAFAVSRDGVRAALIIVGAGGDARLVVASIGRDPGSDSPTAVWLTNVRDVADADFPLKSLTALAWYNPTTLIVLGQADRSDPQPYQIAIDGSRVQPTTGSLPARPRYLAAGSGVDVPPVIGSADGILYSRTPDQQWPQLSGQKPLFAPSYVG